ncbi:hypothetical protein FACS1894186_2770 [Alphaproteobacteria bacterium]|nr:hypothetical protein FACS1894186_2770 [Alphaproteobacteria bacterium]
MGDTNKPKKSWFSKEVKRKLATAFLCGALAASMLLSGGQAKSYANSYSTDSVSANIPAAAMAAVQSPAEIALITGPEYSPSDKMVEALGRFGEVSALGNGVDEVLEDEAIKQFIQEHPNAIMYLRGHGSPQAGHSISLDRKAAPALTKEYLQLMDGAPYVVVDSCYSGWLTSPEGQACIPEGMNIITASGEGQVCIIWHKEAEFYKALPETFNINSPEEMFLYQAGNNKELGDFPTARIDGKVFETKNFFRDSRRDCPRLLFRGAGVFDEG